jgi:hypothetical protein
MYRICRQVYDKFLISNYTYLAEKVIASKPKAKYKYQPRVSTFFDNNKNFIFSQHLFINLPQSSDVKEMRIYSYTSVASQLSSSTVVFLLA